MIAFAQGFPNGRCNEPSPSRRRKPARVARPRLDAGQWLTVGGAALLAGGVFLPFLWHYHLLASPSLWQQEFAVGLPLVSTAMVVLALVSGALGVRRSYVFQWLTGFAAYMGLAGAVLLSAHLASLQPSIIPSNANLNAWPSEPFTFALGFYAIGLGVLLIFGGALVDGILDQRRPTPLVLPTRRFEWPRAEPTWVNRIACRGEVSEG
jgi:hypothetical protein